MTSVGGPSGTGGGPGGRGGSGDNDPFKNFKLNPTRHKTSLVPQMAQSLDAAKNSRKAEKRAAKEAYKIRRDAERADPEIMAREARAANRRRREIRRNWQPAVLPRQEALPPDRPATEVIGVRRSARVNNLRVLRRAREAAAVGGAGPAVPAPVRPVLSRDVFDQLDNHLRTQRAARKAARQMVPGQASPGGNSSSGSGSGPSGSGSGAGSGAGSQPGSGAGSGSGSRSNSSSGSGRGSGRDSSSDSRSNSNSGSGRGSGGSSGSGSRPASEWSGVSKSGSRSGSK